MSPLASRSSRPPSASTWLWVRSILRDSSSPAGKVAWMSRVRYDAVEASTTLTSTCSREVMPAEMRDELIPVGIMLSPVRASTSSSIFSSSRTTSCPSVGRSAGSFDSIRAMRSSSPRGTPVTSSRRRGASSCSVLASTAVRLLPVNGRLPTRQAKSTQPSANTSAAARTSVSPRACSGAMYPMVPTGMPWSVSSLSTSVGRAIPKSSRVALSKRPLRDEDVPRLDVPVHQSPPVRVRQRRGDARPQLQRRREIDLPALEDLAERLPLDPVHHQVGQASLGDAAGHVAGDRQPLDPERLDPVGDVADDRRVAHRRQQLRLAGEAHGRLELGAVEHLHRDGAPLVEIEGAEDRAHPALLRERLEAEPPTEHVPVAEPRASFPPFGHVDCSLT